MPRPRPTSDDISAWCQEYLARTFGRSMDRIDPDAKFSRLGLDSVNSVTLIVALEEWLGMELNPELAVEYPTLRKLSEYLANQLSVNPGAR